MNLKQLLPWPIVFLFALAFSCARQTSPTGGPKDTIPPVLIKSVPPNEALNFNGNKIQLEFSEYVNLNSPKEQLIVTPTIGKDYEITLRRNIVTIEFEEPLLENTTYTFNFREAIQDITERNPAENLSLAYSTGDYIDSLSVDGVIYDITTGKPVKDATVALHVHNDTFNIFLHSPTYFTKTDKDGNFNISHLKPATYLAYAFNDKNRNLIVNSRSEAYGFKSELIELTENVQDVSIPLVRLDAGPLQLTSARPYNTYFNLRTSKNLRTFSLTAVDSSQLSFSFGDDQANIKLYQTTELDSFQIRLVAIDSISNTIDTTVYAKFQPRNFTPEKFGVSLSASSLLAQTGELQATLQHSKPIRSINYDSLYFQADSLTRIHFTPDDLSWDSLKRTITLKKKLNPELFPSNAASNTARSGSRLQRSTTPVVDTTQQSRPVPINELYFGLATFISVENDSSAVLKKTVKPTLPEELAIINIDIRTDEKSFLVQLLDNNLKVLNQIPNQRRTIFRNVIPGNYQIRLIIDKNDNGRWDPGNYFENIEPEPIIYYQAPDGTTSVKGVKANWEIGTDGEMFITY